MQIPQSIPKSNQQKQQSILKTPQKTREKSESHPCTDPISPFQLEITEVNHNEESTGGDFAGGEDYNDCSGCPMDCGCPSS